METRTQNLSLKVLIFETTAGKRTFTDKNAEDLILLFPRQSVWRAGIRRVETAGPSDGGGDSSIHYEMRLVHRAITTAHSPSNRAEAEKAIETLCRDFCNPDGILSPRQVNANPHLVFTPGVDINNPMDDVFLRSFLKHSSRYADAPPPRGTWGATVLPAAWRQSATKIVTSFLTHAFKDAVTALKNPSELDVAALVSGNAILSTVVASARPAAMKAVTEFVTSNLTKESKAGDAGQRGQSGLTTTALEHAISALAELDSAGVDYKAARADDLLGSTRSMLQRLKDSMSTITRQQSQAQVSSGATSSLGKILGVICTASLVVLGYDTLVPGTFQLVQAYCQLLSLGLSVGSGAATLCCKSQAVQARDVAEKLNDADLYIHRRLYLMAYDALQSDYHHRPDAAVFSKFVLDMAAIVNPAALENWEFKLASREELDRKLRLLVKAIAD